ncbi:hypothetical protein PIIN_09422 [Serendipita indica DSM 11827]|uniref:Hypervirulence associated protein TUDOR domain-containing protein n=1 Tax=Serendipita indica (strain DSM 11827) TaxID=1109443 RepID=G4TVU6_SERID|nr:hypothetical protein PIIN_09422 [Serendipita indica DSM 11827]
MSSEFNTGDRSTGTSSSNCDGVLTRSSYAIGGRGGANENSSTTGEITDVLTETAPAGSTGNTVKASADDPRYVIKNDNTGKETAYKGDNIIGKAGDKA